VGPDGVGITGQDKASSLIDAMQHETETETSVTAHAALLLHQQQQQEQVQQLPSETVGSLTGSMSLEGFMKDDQQPDYIKDEQSEYDKHDQSAEAGTAEDYIKEDNQEFMKDELKFGSGVVGLTMPDTCSGNY
jgi:hypothetical protein